MSEIDRLLINLSSAMTGCFNACRIYVRSIETNQAPLFDRGASRDCVPATGHAMHWLMIGENATMFWPSALKLRSIGLFGLVLRFKLQN